MPVARKGAITCTIGGVPFYALGDRTHTRWCLTFLDDAPVAMLNVFHPPGVDGNIVVNNGRTAKRFAITAVYCGELDTLLENYYDDCEAFTGVPVTIVDDSGETWERCYLEGMNRERPTGCEDGAFFLCHMQFTSHNGRKS